MIPSGKHFNEIQWLQGHPSVKKRKSIQLGNFMGFGLSNYLTRHVHRSKIMHLALMKSKLYYTIILTFSVELMLMSKFICNAQTINQDLYHDIVPALFWKDSVPVGTVTVAVDSIPKRNDVLFEIVHVTMFEYTDLLKRFSGHRVYQKNTGQSYSVFQNTVKELYLCSNFV